MPHRNRQKMDAPSDNVEPTSSAGAGVASACVSQGASKNKVKLHRAPKYTELESYRVVKLYLTYKHYFVGEYSKSVSATQKKIIWKKMTALLNPENEFKRTWVQTKKRIETVRKAIRIKSVKNKSEARKIDGGRPYELQFTPSEELLLSSINQACVHGIGWQFTTEGQDEGTAAGEQQVVQEEDGGIHRGEEMSSISDLSLDSFTEATESQEANTFFAPADANDQQPSEIIRIVVDNGNIFATDEQVTHNFRGATDYLKPTAIHSYITPQSPGPMTVQSQTGVQPPIYEGVRLQGTQVPPPDSQPGMRDSVRGKNRDQAVAASIAALDQQAALLEATREQNQLLANLVGKFEEHTSELKTLNVNMMTLSGHVDRMASSLASCVTEMSLFTAAMGIVVERSHTGLVEGTGSQSNVQQIEQAASTSTHMAARYTRDSDESADAIGSRRLRTSCAKQTKKLFL